MKHIFNIHTMLLTTLILATGCWSKRLKVDQYETWKDYMSRKAEALKAENEKKRAEIKKLEADEEQKKRYKEFQIGKSEVLIKENASLEETWDGMGVESHEVMMNLFSRIHDSEMAFYDVRLGNPPQKKALMKQSEKYTVLVDMGRTVQEDCHIQMAEIYTSKEVHSTKPGTGSVCFIILNNNKETGKYHIRSSSGFLPINSIGKNGFTFTNRPLEAKKDDRYGAILAPGASIDYEKLDLGSFCEIPMDSIPDTLSRVSLSLTTPSPRSMGSKVDGAMDIALMLRGTSDRKSMFIVEGTPFEENKLLSKVLVNIKNTPNGKPLPVYFAVLEKKVSAKGVVQYTLGDMSQMTMVTPGEKREILLKHVKKQDGRQTFNVKKGDLCALLMPGITDLNKVKTDERKKGVFKTVEPFDYSKPRFSTTLVGLQRESAKSKELSTDIIIVTFEVE